MDGVLVLDKPPGLTSHDVVAAVRRASGERRIGHTGTLDPLATGVLPLACGKATRLVRFLTASDKEYEATIRFGVTTDSYDVTGTETSRSDRQPDREAVTRAMASLTGSYRQMPPAYSAKKVAGHRAYALARTDKAVTLEAVPVTVARTELLDFAGASARISLTCSAGFYVRTFAHSLGELVGSGACLEALRRTRSGDFTLAEAVTLEDVLMSGSDAFARLVPLNRLLPGFPALQLSPEDRQRVSHGQTVQAAGSGAEWVRLIDPDGHLVALATPAAGRPDSLHPAVVLI